MVPTTFNYLPNALRGSRRTWIAGFVIVTKVGVSGLFRHCHLKMTFMKALGVIACCLQGLGVLALYK